MQISKVAVIGSGTMGNGIAHCFAQKGFEVYLVDISKENLEKQIRGMSKTDQFTEYALKRVTRKFLNQFFFSC